MKVLGLTCSASACERNWSTFNQVHTKRRNRLTTKRMNDLVYIMYNKKLKQKFIKKGTLKEEEDPLVLENVVSDDEWIAEPADGEAAIEGGETGGERSDGVREPSTREGGESSSSVKRKAAQKKVQSRKKKAAQIHLIDEEDEFEDMENETDEEGEYEEQDDSESDSFYVV
jgi:hypothetical protein